jgi:prepilin-type N-terminal cleavage/methylation domain-containing protein
MTRHLRRAASSPCPARRGMTMLELLAVLAIIGGLSAIIATIFTHTIRSRQVIIGHIDMVDRARGIMDLVVQDLADMHTFDSRAYLFVEVNDFNGQNGTAIAFPSATTTRVSKELRERPGLMEIAYLVGEQAGEQPGLLRLFRRELHVQTDTNVTSIEASDQGIVLLAEDVKEFRMEFLSAEAISETEEGEEPEFEEEWESGHGTESIPVAIRVHLTVAGGRMVGDLTLQRTVRLPTRDVAMETLQGPLEQALGLVE